MTHFHRGEFKELYDYILLLYRRIGLTRLLSGMILSIVASLVDLLGLFSLLPLFNILAFNSSPSMVPGINQRIVSLFSTFSIPVSTWSVIVLFMLLLVIRDGITRINQIFFSKTTQSLTFDLRKRLHEKLVHTEWLMISQCESSKILHVLDTDVEKIGYATSNFFSMTTAIFLFTVQTGFAMSLSPSLTLFMLVCSTFLLYLLQPFTKKMLSHSYSVHKDRLKIFDTMKEHFQGLKAVRIQGLETHYHESSMNYFHRIAMQQISFQKNHSLYIMLHHLFMSGLICFYLLMAIEVFHIPTTEILLIAGLLFRINGFASHIHQNWHIILSNIPSLSTYQEAEKQLAPSPREISVSPNFNSIPLTLQKQIQIDGLSFRYPKKENWIFQNFHGTIPAHRITAIVGASGTGKSTLADLLVGLLDPQEGSIRIDGIPLTQANAPLWRRSVGYVSQENFLFKATLRENIQCSWEIEKSSEEKVWHALHLANLDDFVRHLPNRLDTLYGEQGITLSGGERQRIALARAVYRNPQLLILDEATNALDAQTETTILETIQKMKETITIILITHHRHPQSIADHIITL